MIQYVIQIKIGYADQGDPIEFFLSIIFLALIAKIHNSHKDNNNKYRANQVCTLLHNH